MNSHKKCFNVLFNCALALSLQAKVSMQIFSSCIPAIPAARTRASQMWYRADGDSRCGNDTSAAEKKPGTLFTLHAATPPVFLPTHTENTRFGSYPHPHPPPPKQGKNVIGVMTF